jgi:hypothetical protein
MLNAVENSQQTTLPQKPPSPRPFRKAFGFGMVWWIVVSSVGVALSHTRRPGIIFGAQLGTCLIAAVVAGTAGRLIRTRATWLLVVAAFLFVWFALRFLIIANGIVTGQ